MWLSTPSLLPRIQSTSEEVPSVNTGNLKAWCAGHPAGGDCRAGRPSAAYESSALTAAARQLRSPEGMKADRQVVLGSVDG